MTGSEWEKLGFVHIGDVAVDSGSVMFVDPCYVLRDNRDYDLERLPEGVTIDDTMGRVNNRGYLTVARNTNLVDDVQVEVGKNYDDMLRTWFDAGYETTDYVTPWGKDFGIIVGTAHGDGCFPVYARYVDGWFGGRQKIGQVVVDFDPDDADDLEDYDDD